MRVPKTSAIPGEEWQANGSVSRGQSKPDIWFQDAGTPVVCATVHAREKEMQCYITANTYDCSNKYTVGMLVNNAVYMYKCVCASNIDRYHLRV